MKHLIGSCCLALVTLFTFSSNSYAQGLGERRAVAEYQESKFKQLKADIVAAAGFEVPVTVEWTKIALPGESANYSQDGFWTNIYFVPLAGALKAITKDELGKSALKEKLKEISITFDEATAPASNYPNGITFNAGKLIINFKPWSNADDLKEREAAIQKVLEENL